MPDSLTEGRDARNDAGRNRDTGSKTGSTVRRHHHAAVRAAAVTVTESLRVVERHTVAFAEGKGELTVTITVAGRLSERLQIPRRIAVAIAVSVTRPVKTPLTKRLRISQGVDTNPPLF